MNNVIQLKTKKKSTDCKKPLDCKKSTDCKKPIDYKKPTDISDYKKIQSLIRLVESFQTSTNKLKKWITGDLVKTVVEEVESLDLLDKKAKTELQDIMNDGQHQLQQNGTKRNEIIMEEMEIKLQKAKTRQRITYSQIRSAGHKRKRDLVNIGKNKRRKMNELLYYRVKKIIN